MATYHEAKEAIASGTAKAHASWMLLSSPADRDGFALKPGTWEGPGEYQRVVFDDGRDVLVKLPAYRSFPVAA